MKRALAVLLASAAIAVGQGNVSSEFQNAPAQSQNPAQPAQPAPLLPPQPAQGAPASSTAQSGSPGRRLELPREGRPFLRPGQQYCHLGRKKLEHQQQRAFSGPFREIPQCATGGFAPGDRISGDSFNRSWRSFRLARSRLDRPMRRSSFWRKPRDIKRMPISAIRSRTKFSPPGSLAKITTG